MLANLQRHATQIGLGLLLVGFFLAHAGGAVRAPFIDRLEHLAYDVRLVFTMPGGVDERIVIIDIDEKSLKAEGRWPWSRDKIGRMLEAMFNQYQVGLVGFDVVFAEKDESSGVRTLERLRDGSLSHIPEYAKALEKLGPELDLDGRLADIMERYPVVLGYLFGRGTGEQQSVSGALPPPVLGEDAFARRSIPFVKATGFSGNIEILQNAALGAGHFNPWVDDDGVVRKVPLLYEYEGQYYGALALTMAQLAAGVDSIEPGFPPDSRPGGAYQGMEWIQLGPASIPVDESARALVPFRGEQGSFRYVSATDLLNGKVEPAVLQNKIVLVGTSAPGLLDLRATPVQNLYAGVEVHANLIAGILDSAIKEDPAYTVGAEFLLLVLWGFSLAILLPIFSPLAATATSVVAVITYAGINLWFWSAENLVLSLAPGLVMIPALYLLNMSYGFFVESRGKRQLAGLFGQYIPPELVDEMSIDPTHYSMDAQSRDMSVLFTDVRGFTTISEGLDPKELSELMSEFLSPMTEIIHRNRGTIDKYMGDAVMCFWGAPLSDPDHARHALEAALEMRKAIEELQPRFEEKGWPPIRIGIGINSGVMSVGDMGSRFRRAYTVLGDAVNLGSRLEGQTKSYGVDLIVGEDTRAAIGGFAFRELDRIRVKGKDKPVTIYEPIGPKEAMTDADNEELKLYKSALKQFRAQNWDSAEIQFVNLQKAHPDRLLYEIYLDRIGVYRADPPGSGWDGVYTALTK